MEDNKSKQIKNNESKNLSTYVSLLFKYLYIEYVKQ